MVYRKASAENESNKNISNDEHSVSQKVDHDDVTIAAKMTTSTRGEVLPDPQHCNKPGSISCYYFLSPLE